MRPIPDALMLRYTRPGIAAIARVPEHRMAAFLEGGWIVMISTSQIEAQNIVDTYQADLRGLKERR